MACIYSKDFSCAKARKLKRKYKIVLDALKEIKTTEKVYSQSYDLAVKALSKIEILFNEEEK